MKKYIITIASVLVLFGCSSSKEVEQVKEQPEQKEQVYVFDDETTEQPTVVVTEPEVKNEIKVEEEPVNLFYVQVGAYTTRDAANKFKQQNQKKIQYDMSIVFDDSKGLYVLQLAPYSSKSEAESVRNELWKIKDFKDAWIREDSK